MTSVPSASDIAPARHEKWELEKAPILFSVSSIRRISVGRKRDWHMVVLAVLDFEHHFDERVERILLQSFEVGRHVIRQAVDALVSVVPSSRKSFTRPFSSVSFSSSSTQVLPSG